MGETRESGAVAALDFLCPPKRVSGGNPTSFNTSTRSSSHLVSSSISRPSSLCPRRALSNSNQSSVGSIRTWLKKRGAASRGTSSDYLLSGSEKQELNTAEEIFSQLDFKKDGLVDLSRLRDYFSQIKSSSAQKLEAFLKCAQRE